MKKFGIKLDGCEERIEELLKFSLLSKESEFVFLEVGTAEGATTKAVSEILKESDHPWRIISLDLVEGWSHNMKNLFSIGENLIYKNASTEEINSIFGLPQKVNVFFVYDPRSLIQKLPDNSIDFGFIDGCHGCPCVMEDFLAIENKVREYGLVMFHDVGDAEQGQDFQPHCNEFISVKNALQKLGLLDGSRPNWVIADYIKSNEHGNDCIVFQKNMQFNSY